MAVRADAEDLQIDPPALDDALLVPVTEGRIVAGRAGRDADVVRRDVDVPKKMLVHETVIALRVIPVQADVFVEIERGHPREIDLHTRVDTHELLIHPERRGAR